MNRELGGYSGREKASQQTSGNAEKRTRKKPSTAEFYERAKATGAFEKRDGSGPVLDERRQALLEAYFTTPATLEDLRPLAGGVSRDRVRQLVTDTFEKIARNLPEEMQDEYLWMEETPRGTVRSGVIGLHHLEKPKKPGDRER